ncbi:2-oxo-4-hydroxy-4-carboxy-5-ureidoimidazoline decarboxylase [Methylobrevis pamukkalensis]|uniref:2-oxo-4-hydroxy-4-carboxy-5-ureidoimidazoline decarboxylase n=1 Tax=Methylobrevis pamukkalensis TaxID=1439726 RepID=A0A1E3H059_9HYPH|nr:2-oxo-4-hydroxy-4-carboxy-5-ureidoimidazoline decarboxylase [Methylobrevis pamukkalensis]ODN69672.1 Uric acid degradation bifunctional protein [Methylobrevis pamukkalensis]
MNGAVPISVVNRLPRADFLARFEDVAEHSPWVAELAELSRPYPDRDAMILAFINAVEVAPEAEKIGLIRAHPDLAGKAAIAGEIAEDSRREQAGAGLSQLTPEEFSRFQDLNTRYRKRFGFPFILAVKGASKDTILAEFGQRVHNDPGLELLTALTQIGRIFRFRIEDRVLP